MTFNIYDVFNVQMSSAYPPLNSNINESVLNEANYTNRSYVLIPLPNSRFSHNPVSDYTVVQHEYFCVHKE